MRKAMQSGPFGRKLHRFMILRIESEINKRVLMGSAPFSCFYTIYSFSAEV